LAVGVEEESGHTGVVVELAGVGLTFVVGVKWGTEGLDMLFFGGGNGFCLLGLAVTGVVAVLAVLLGISEEGAPYFTNGYRNSARGESSGSD
jgi:hypothetical protein